MFHKALNDIVSGTFSSAGIPMMTEPGGMSRSDGKRPGGLSVIR